MGDQPGRPVRPLAQPRATASSTSTASSAARPTSTTRRCTRARRRSTRRRRPKQGYHLMEDLADRGIAWVRQQKALTPDQPFFLYFAPGATHTPHHVPKEWADKYDGQFDDGWDALREQTFARQKELGVIGDGAELTERHDEIPAWADTDDELKPVLARQMENYAGFLEYADHHVGRLIDAIARARRARRHARLLHHRRQRRLRRGHARSARSTRCSRSTAAATSRPSSSCASTSTRSASPSSYPHYAVGWAHALCTPYQWTKQVASHWGGTRNGTIVHWPNGIEAKGELRHQFTHVIDVAPTVLEAAGLPEPDAGPRHHAEADGGHVSMTYAFDDAAARRAPRDAVLRDVLQPRHLPQGLVGGDQAPDAVELRPPRALLRRRRLGALRRHNDWTQAHDLSAEQPDKLHELQRLFLIEAARHNVLPLDDRQAERMLPEVAGRPTLLRRQHADALSGHGRAERELRARPQEPLARGHRRGRRARRAAPRAC